MFDAGPLPHRWEAPRAEPGKHARFYDRLKALGAFSGIAIGAVAGFEMVIGGGFDFITPPTDVREIAPSRFVTVQQVPWSSRLQVIPLSSTEPLFAQDPYVQRASDRLVGGYDDERAPDLAFPEIDEAELHRRIAELYANDVGPSYQDAPIIYDDANAMDEPRRSSRTDPYAEAEAMVRQALGPYEPTTAAVHPS